MLPLVVIAVSLERRRLDEARLVTVIGDGRLKSLLGTLSWIQEDGWQMVDSWDVGPLEDVDCVDPRLLDWVRSVPDRENVSVAVSGSSALILVNTREGAATLLANRSLSEGTSLASIRVECRRDR